MKLHLLAVAVVVVMLCGAPSPAQFSRNPHSPRNSNPQNVLQLKQKLAALEAKRAQLLFEYRPASPEIRVVEAAIRSLRQQLSSAQSKPAKPMRPRSKVRLLSV